MQEQQQKQPLKLRQRIQVAIQIAKMFSKASGQDSTALQVEDVLVNSFEQKHISEQTIQMFNDRFERVRQAAPHAYLEEIYMMGGVLIYNSILLPVLIGPGVPDFPTRLAWIAFSISFPSAVGFFLIRFLKEKNSISSYGRIHGILALLPEIGVFTITAGLLFHVWNVIGWLFLLCTIVIIIGYQWYRFVIYFKPHLAVTRDIFKKLSETPPSGQDAEP